MEKISVEAALIALREEIAITREWHDVMMSAHNAYITMGTFQEPLDDTLIGLTWGQWQLETARRIVLAVIDAIAEQIAEVDRERARENLDV